MREGKLVIDRDGELGFRNIPDSLARGEWLIAARFQMTEPLEIKICGRTKVVNPGMKLWKDAQAKKLDARIAEELGNGESVKCAVFNEYLKLY